jgi:phage shock protein A
MSESIGLRVKRVVSAKFNDLVDAMEASNPDGVLREAVREVDAALEDVQAELGRVMASRQNTIRVIERTEQKIAEMATKIASAIDMKRDDLAEAAIARQLDLEGELPVVRKSLDELAARQSELDGYVAALRSRRREMEEEIDAFIKQRRAAGGDTPEGRGACAVNAAEKRVEKADKAFQRILGGSGGMTAADARSMRDNGVKLQELERAERTNAVAARLKAAKARAQG